MRLPKYHVCKLDKRHKAYGVFSHYVEMTHGYNSRLDKKLYYFELRNWCWKTWGSSMERDDVLLISRDYSIVQWAWHRDKWTDRLYFESTKQLSWFVLNWPQFDGDE